MQFSEADDCAGRYDEPDEEARDDAIPTSQSIGTSELRADNIPQLLLHRNLKSEQSWNGQYDNDDVQNGIH